MKDIILEQLKEIEARYGVRVLLAVETGSRAWGFASSDSDYDVRFVYIHQRDWYLSILPGRDVIEEMSDDHVFDLSGWDLKKALYLMSKCNCSFAEWLASPIVYFADHLFLEEINKLKNQYFRKVSAANHYYHMAVNDHHRLATYANYSIKRFLYHTRGLLAAKWSLEKDSYPPVPFTELVDAEVEDASIRELIAEVVRKKMAGRELDDIHLKKELFVYVSSLAANMSLRIRELHKGESISMDSLDRFFLKMLDYSWKV